MAPTEGRVVTESQNDSDSGSVFHRFGIWFRRILQPWNPGQVLLKVTKGSQLVPLDSLPMVSYPTVTLSILRYFPSKSTTTDVTLKHWLGSGHSRPLHLIDRTTNIQCNVIAYCHW